MASITGTSGNDTLIGTTGADVINALDGDDLIDGGDQDDVINAGGGNDTILVTPNHEDDTIDGGTGYDLVDFTALTADADLTFSDNYTARHDPGLDEAELSNVEEIWLGAGDDTVDATETTQGTNVDAGVGNDELSGGSGSDTLRGGDGVDSIYGNAGNDSLDGGAGNDQVWGGTGNDNIAGGDGNDLLGGDDGDDTIAGGTGNDTMYGGGGQDVFVIEDAFGSDSIEGGEADEPGIDFDRIDFSAVTVSITVTFSGAETGTATDGTSTLSFNQIEALTLTDQADRVDGANNSANVLIDGGAGDDTIEYGTGDSTVYGGDGNDIIDEQPGIQVGGSSYLDGGAGNDSIYAGEGDDTVLGGDGNDYLAGEQGNNSVAGGSGDDTLTGGTGNSTLLGEAGNDHLYAEGGAQLADGGTGNDTLFAGWGSSTLLGGDDSDTVYVETGDGTITVDGGEGGTDLDGISFTDSSYTGVQVLASGFEQGSASYFDAGATASVSYVNIERFDGTNQADLFDLDLSSGNTIVYGLAGDDSVDFGAGNDLLYGGDGTDTATGGDGSDTLYGEVGSDTLYGGLGNDFVDGGADNDLIDGGEGGDLIYGGDGADTILGSGGIDTIYGGAGLDSIDGGDDRDRIMVEDGFGNDTILGGEGGNDEDTLDLTALSGATTISYSGDEAGTVTDGTDTLSFSQIETVLGGGSADIVDAGTTTGGVTAFGGGGNDTIAGGSGADTLSGDSGNDSLDGGAGADSIDAGSGDDTVVMGSGDTVFGGDNDDLFIITPDNLNGTAMTLTGGEGGETAGDTLQITGPAEFTWTDAESGTVTWLDGTTLTFSEIENVDYTACFTPGTRILTIEGAMPVEDVRPGTMVLTRDSGYQPVMWAGRRHLTFADLGHAPQRSPIYVPAGALGPGMPERGMLVSPQHRFLIRSSAAELYFGQTEVLVTAQDLCALPGIERLSPEIGVTYVHFMFDRHELVMSDNTWTESFQPGDLSLAGLEAPQREEILALFPELALKGGVDTYPAARLSLKKYQARAVLLH